MRRKLVLLSIIPIVAVLMFSCKKKTVQDEAQIRFKTYEVKKDHHLNGNEKNPALSIAIHLQFPESYSDANVLGKVKKIVLSDFFPDISKDISDPQVAIDTYVKEYIKFYDTSENNPSNVDKEVDMTASETAWWDNEKMIIRNNSDSILSYSIESDRFTGGAHGGRTFQNTAIDLRTGERITEHDLFTEESRPLVVDMILKKIMQKFKVEKPEDLEQIGFFDVTDIDLNKNFYITQKGIVYTYNEYEIAAYALGTINIELSYQDISGYLVSGSSLLPLIP